MYKLISELYVLIKSKLGIQSADLKLYIFVKLNILSSCNFGKDLAYKIKISIDVSVI
jgi:hypothetical protein